MTETTTSWPESDLSLDRLAAMTPDELTDLYLAGRVPDAAIVALSGAPPCRMLAVRGPIGRGPAAGAVRWFAGWAGFPWAGKRFTPLSDQAGTGVNRVRLASLERGLFPFSTRIGVSAMDGLPCIVLDYEQPENPWPIRQIHDELREVAPGLFLGPAMWRTKNQPVLLFFFGADMG